jgi:hypothetical protein
MNSEARIKIYDKQEEEEEADLKGLIQFSFVIAFNFDLTSGITVIKADS